jgi:cytochrome c biogenesis protein
MAVRSDPKAPSAPPLDGAGWLRWAWRQLTSMRIALLLLFMLALASIPGSIFPQSSSNPILAQEWIDDAGSWGLFLQRIGMFEVYGSVWFSAIYLLLFVSLIGCIVPRIAHYWRVFRAKPPAAPKRLDRLPESHSFTVGEQPAAVLERAQRALGGWRVRAGSDGAGD